MPSRAASGGPGGFAYYEHVVLPESEKTLVWEMAGRRYRSQVVIRNGGRRRTEAYLFSREGNDWRPVTIADGTISDGRCETYSRCVESICGSADTFFTSVFAAQGRRHLSQYRNAEIKGLLADLLGLDEIGQLGSRAQEVARGLKSGLIALRTRQAELSAEEDKVRAAQEALPGVEHVVAAAMQACAAARSECDAAQLAQACLLAEQAQSAAADEQRARLQDRLRLTAAAQQRSELEWQQHQHDLRDRADRLDRRIAQRRAASRQQRIATEARLQRCVQLLADAARVERAHRRLPLVRRVVAARSARVDEARAHLESAVQAREALALAKQRLAAVEQSAGRAALRAQELQRRFALTDAVPCRGLPLQGRCQLLGDAREAASLMPSARSEIDVLAEERAGLLRDIGLLEPQGAQFQDTTAALRDAERRAATAAAREADLRALAGRRAELLRAQDDQAALLDELQALQRAETGDAPEDERAEREAIVAGREESDRQRRARYEAHRADGIVVEQMLATLPPCFESRRLADAAARVSAARHRLEQAEQAHVAALADLHKCQAADAELSRHERRRLDLDASIARVHSRLADWLLFARCMSHDGLIALAIEDAGPALSGLANDLLLACYGARFTVAIRTQVETAKGEAREGFDIEVHDSESGDRKSVALMSGGERVWISCRSRHEIHYAGSPIMPSQGSSDQHPACDCPPGTCRATRHRTARSAAFTSGASKSISLMSGGERTWIDACMTRAIALYLTQHSGRRYATLFSDEADGPLDPEHKRMFIALKREVLRLGGYEREYFITQTPELAAMADVVIDLDSMHVDGRGRSNSSTTEGAA